MWLTLNSGLLCLMLMLAPSVADAANWFVSAAGNNTAGTNWTTAYTQLASAHTAASRGDTIYVADGTYNGATLNKATSGVTVITIKKCSASDHGTETGYSAAICDGQATFTGDIQFGTDNWTWNGVYRTESNWDDGTAYGFRLLSAEFFSSDQAFAVCADNVTIKYTNAGGPETSVYNGTGVGEALYNLGVSNLCQNWQIDHNYLHNADHFTIIQFAGVDGQTVEYNLLKNGWGKEALRGQSIARNLTIRYNRFHNACGTTGVVGEGCTGEIAIWDGGAGAFNNVKIYGNTFYRTRDENSGGTIIVGGDGVSWAGSPTNNTLVYNNTIAGIQIFSAVAPSITINGGTGNICRNTLWYDVIGTPTCLANTTSNNGEVTVNPFVDYGTGNLRLSGHTAAGFAIGAPYDVTMDGVTRKSWDRGAFEFATGGDLTPPAAPTNLLIQ